MQATSRLPTEGTMKCSRIAHGFGCGSTSGFVAEVKPKAGLGFRASAAFLSSAYIRKSFRIPIRMRRPPATREALRRSPVMKTGRAHSSCIEGVPFVSAIAEPFVFFARRPVAKGAADARAGCVEALLFIQFVINNHGGLVVRYGTHASIL